MFNGILSHFCWKHNQIKRAAIKTKCEKSIAFNLQTVEIFCLSFSFLIGTIIKIQLEEMKFWKMRRKFVC